MERKIRKRFVLAGGLFLAFAVFTAFLVLVDVKPIGPAGSMVGLATINQYIFHLELICFHQL